MGTGCRWKFFSVRIRSWIVISILIILTIWSTVSILWEISWISLFWWSTSITRVIRWLVSWIFWIMLCYCYVYFCLVGLGLSSFIGRMIYLVLCCYVVCSGYLVAFVYIRQCCVRVFGNNYSIFWKMVYLWNLGFSKICWKFQWFFQIDLYLSLVGCLYL